MKALSIYAGPRALEHIRRNGLSAQDIRLIPAAAGGPKGLILTHLDRFLFSEWLPKSQHVIDLVGVSIGAWRMVSGMTPDPRATFELFASGYTDEYYEPPAGKKLPTPGQLSQGMLSNLKGMFEANLNSILAHDRYRLHIVTSRGRRVLHQASHARSLLGFSALALSNAVSRKAMGGFLERIVFSTNARSLPGALEDLALQDLPTRRAALNRQNFYDVVRASCSIPFLFETIRDIGSAPSGTYWDGGIIDYHLHWNYAAMTSGLVLYPHFQQQVIPGWLDKPVRWRKGPASHLSNVVLLAPNPQWLATLPGGKLPDRKDLTNMSWDQRTRAWRVAIAEARRLADEFEQWLLRGMPADVIQAL